MEHSTGKTNSVTYRQFQKSPIQFSFTTILKAVTELGFLESLVEPKTITTITAKPIQVIVLIRIGSTGKGELGRIPKKRE